MKTVKEIENHFETHSQETFSHIFVNQSYDVHTTICSCGEIFDTDTVWYDSIVCPKCQSKHLILYRTNYTNNPIQTFKMGIIFSLETRNENELFLARDELLYHINTEDFTIQKESIRKGYISYKEGDKTFYAYMRKPNGTYKKTKNIVEFITFQKQTHVSFSFPDFTKIENTSSLYHQTGFKELIHYLQDHCCFWRDYHIFEKFIRYLHYFQKNPQIEQLLKSGYHRVAIDSLRDNLTLTEYLKKTSKGSKMIPLPPYVLDYIKKETLRFDLVDQLIILHTNGGEIKKEFFEYMIEHSLFNLSDIKHMISLTKLGFSIQNIYEYLERADLYQAIPPSKTLGLWDDYVLMAVDCEIPYDKYPNSLRKSHDLLARDYKFAEDEISRKKYKEAVKGKCNLEYSNETYCILLPKEVREIVQEGNTLRHCVASYIRRVIRNETLILFLRKKDDPHTPFYTIELNGNEVFQVKGFLNKKATPEINAFVKEWKKRKIKKAM